MSAASAARPSSRALCSSNTSAFTRARSPTGVKTAARPSEDSHTSSGTYGPTRVRSPSPATPVAKLLARAISSSSTRGCTATSSAHPNRVWVNLLLPNEMDMLYRDTARHVLCPGVMAKEIPFPGRYSAWSPLATSL